MAMKAKTPGGSGLIVPAEPPRELPTGVPQTLVGIGGERLVVLPERDYQILLEAARDNLEDAEASLSAATVLARLQGSSESTLPRDVVQRLGRENRIKVLREWQQMTQRELAERTGTNPVYISQLETGRARGGFDILAKIAEALGVTIDLVAPKRVKRPDQTIRNMLRFVTGEQPDGTESEALLAFLDTAAPEVRRGSIWQRTHAAAERFHRSQDGTVDHRAAREMLREYLDTHYPGQRQRGMRMA